MEIKVLKNFSLQKKLGSGAFGEIFQAQHCGTKEKYAVKLEKISSPFPQLAFEAKIYSFIHNDRQARERGIPRFIGFGMEGEFNVMVMELLGPSLEDLFERCKRKFSLKTTLMLADQMITRIEYFHSKNFIHRDVKPDNFSIGLENERNKLFLYDFGLSKRFVGKDGLHISYKDNKSLTGTARYASINNHMGIEQSRRDDLESLGYIFVYFLNGILPWQNMKAKGKEDKYKMILEKKMSTPIDFLCRGLPSEFGKFLSYCRNLKFDDKPDYSYMRRLFKQLMADSGFEYDFEFDWSSKFKKKGNMSATGQRKSSEIERIVQKEHMLEKKALPRIPIIPQIKEKTVGVHLPNKKVNSNSRQKPSNSGSRLNQTKESLFKTTAGSILQNYTVEKYPQPKIVTCKK